MYIFPEEQGSRVFSSSSFSTKTGHLPRSARARAAQFPTRRSTLPAPRARRFHRKNENDPHPIYSAIYSAPARELESPSVSAVVQRMNNSCLSPLDHAADPRRGR